VSERGALLLEVTDETPARALSISDIVVGDTVAQRVVFDAEKHSAFACLARDRARIHDDASFARQSGFDAPIIQGLAVASRFSRLLGMYLPGEKAILQKIEFKYHRPVYAGRELLYGCKVRQLLKPLRVVVLALSVSNGVDYVSGQCQCLIL
jgi:3-hydroxybutyryl-CoA dehydratase